jgi:hypothetical protein
VGVGVETARVLQRRVEAALAVADEAGPSKLKAGWNHLDVTLAQRVVDDVLILLHQQGAGGVHNVAAAAATSVYQVNGRQQQLLLEVRAAPDVLAGGWGKRGGRGKEGA